MRWCSLIVLLMAATSLQAQDSLQVAKEWQIYHTEKVHLLPLLLSLALNLGLIIYLIYLHRKIRK